MKEISPHLSLGLSHQGPHVFLTLKAQGMLNHEDYEALTPLLDSTLDSVDAPKIQVYIDAVELKGWTPIAAWDDLKLGLAHRDKFDRVAIHGNKAWQHLAAKIGSWFLSGEVEYFEDAEQAREWLVG